MITFSLLAPTGWKYRLLDFSIAPTRRRLRPPWLYQHLLDGSTNSLLYRHRLEGSFDSLPCATLPPYNMNQFTTLLICFASISMFLHMVTPLHQVLDSVLPQSPCIYTSNHSCHCHYVFDCLISALLYSIYI